MGATTMAVMAEYMALGNLRQFRSLFSSVLKVYRVEQLVRKSGLTLWGENGDPERRAGRKELKGTSTMVLECATLCY